jgi:hypothetical protein
VPGGRAAGRPSVKFRRSRPPPTPVSTPTCSP